MIKLYINSTVYDKFTTLSIQNSVESIANGFTLTFAGDNLPVINAEDSIIVEYDGTQMLTGFIENENANDSLGTKVSYTGRSNSGQLIGPSVEGISEFKNKKLDYILKEIIKPFGLQVNFISDVGTKIDKFTIEPSEDAYSAIARLLKLRNMIGYDINGVLTVRNSYDVSYQDTIDSTNFIITVSKNYSNLYSSYTVIGSGKQKTIKYIAKNPNVKKYRPKTIIADTKIDQDTAKKQAEFEMQKANGKSLSVTASGSSWKQKNGELWSINGVAPVYSKAGKLSENMLISSILYSYSTSGEKISMTLVSENTFDNPESNKTKTKTSTSVVS